MSLIVIAFLPFMFVFSLHFNRKMNRAMRLSKERVAEVNAQVEDTSGRYSRRAVLRQ